MKTWTRDDEWMQLAACGGSLVHTAENPTRSDCERAASICRTCKVRPECIQWAIREKCCSVFVAGIYLPDPRHKKELKKIYTQLDTTITEEKQLRGENI